MAEREGQAARSTRPRPRAPTQELASNEIRVNSRNPITEHVNQLNDLLKTHDTVVISALGQSIAGAIVIAEKVRIPAGLHKVTEISTVRTQTEEGEDGRNINRLVISLSKKAPPKAASLPGYEAPVPIGEAPGGDDVAFEWGWTARRTGGRRGPGAARGRGGRGGPRTGGARRGAPRRQEAAE